MYVAQWQGTWSNVVSKASSLFLSGDGYLPPPTLYQNFKLPERMQMASTNHFVQFSRLSHSSKRKNPSSQTAKCQHCKQVSKAMSFKSIVWLFFLLVQLRFHFGSNMEVLLRFLWSLFSVQNVSLQIASTMVKCLLSVQAVQSPVPKQKPKAKLITITIFSYNFLRFS